MRDAERGVHDVGLDYRARGACFDAERACAAVVFDARRVVFEFHVQDKLAEEDPRAVLASDEVRVLAYPTEPRAHGPSLVHRGLRVHADLALSFGHKLSDGVE